MRLSIEAITWQRKLSADKWTLTHLVWGSTKGRLLHGGRRARIHRWLEGRCGCGFTQKWCSCTRRAEQVQWQSPASATSPVIARPGSQWWGRSKVKLGSHGHASGSRAVRCATSHRHGCNVAQARTDSLVCLCLNAVRKWSQKDPASYSSCSDSAVWQLALSTAAKPQEGGIRKIQLGTCSVRTSFPRLLHLTVVRDRILASLKVIFMVFLFLCN